MFFSILLLSLSVGLIGGAISWVVLRARGASLVLSLVSGLLGAYLAIAGSGTGVFLPASWTELAAPVGLGLLGAFVLSAIITFTLGSRRARNSFPSK
jgi:hypothetical protein